LGAEELIAIAIAVLNALACYGINIAPIRLDDLFESPKNTKVEKKI